MHIDLLVSQVEFIHHVVKRNTEHIDHAESLLSPVGGGNSFNWVLGHMVYTRNESMIFLNQAPLFPKEALELYRDAPLTETRRAIEFEALLSQYDQLKNPYIEGLKKLTEKDLKQPAPEKLKDIADNLGELLARLIFHEAYHAGQLGLLRRITGRAGAIRLS